MVCDICEMVVTADSMNVRFRENELQVMGLKVGREKKEQVALQVREKVERL